MNKFLVFFLCMYYVRASLDREITEDVQYRSARSTNEECEPILPALTSPKTGQKAWDKCVEYQEQLIFPCEKSAATQDKATRVNKCTSNTDTLIVRHEADPNEFPHMALLGNGEHPKYSWYCNAALISERFILSAGHCTSNRETGPFNIAALGAHKVEDIQDSNLYKLSEIIRHPSFIAPQKYNDIALFKTEKPVKLDQSVVPACLYVGDQVDDHRGLYTGWNLGENSTGIIQIVRFDKYSDDECKAAFTSFRLLKQGINATTQVCYGDKSNSIDTCRAQSGGPIQIKSKKLNCMYVILGVASFGKRCGHSTTPDVYTRVVSYVPWIESVVWPDTE